MKNIIDLWLVWMQREQGASYLYELERTKYDGMKKRKKEEVNINKTKYRILFYSNFLKERNRIKIIFVRKYDRNLKLILKKKCFNKLGNQKIEKEKRELLIYNQFLCFCLNN